MLQRAKKEPEKFHQADPLDYCLECWKFYMGGTRYANLDAKPMGGMTANEDGYGTDPNEAQLNHDTKIGAAVNASIESLSKRQKWAIYKTHGLGQVIQFNFADLIQTYEEATVQLKQKLHKNFDTSYLF